MAATITNKCRLLPGGPWASYMVFAAVALTCAHAQDLSACCGKASDTCRNVCDKMSMLEAQAVTGMREESLQNINKFCSSQLTEFWICMNQTIQEVVSGADWWGRACCSQARALPCRQACATSAGDLAPTCRRSDELPLFDCVQRQHEAQWCCSQTQSLTCHEACRKVMWNVGQSHIDLSARERALEACEQSPPLMQCLRDLTGSTVHGDTAKYLPCCHESSNLECRSSCEAVLRRSAESQEIFQVLAGSCGAPVLHDAMWKCFLRKDAPTKDVMPHDGAKLHCCYNSATINCRQLCFKTYGTGWQSNWQKFYAECLTDPQENRLTRCIEEVETPCSLGCAGLTYCSEMNSRPTTLFRSCTPQADFDAHLAVTNQRDSGVVVLAGMELPLRNSSQCPAELWKSVACALHIKPCTFKGHSSQLCSEDCHRVVSLCVDWTRTAPALNTRAVCARLAPSTDDAPCLLRQDFVNPSSLPPLLSPDEALRSPCSGPGNPCNGTQMCLVNRNCLHGASCAKFTCVNGCSLGDGSPQTVPQGTWVRIPMPGGGQKACYKICRCSARGLTHCQPLPCYGLDACQLHEKVVPHGGKYYMECNECACYAGERICSARACPAGAGARALLTRLPCNCPPHYVPATTPSRDYPNACLAKCAGATDAEIEFVRRTECTGTACGRHACLPRRNVCLSRLQVHCPQHVCVNTTNCSAQPPQPVCDTDGRTHSNPCYLVMSGRRLSYWGECLLRCSKTGEVCGTNGVTYMSECAAWAEYSSVDYHGPCRAVGPISNAMEPKCKIDRITCPQLKKPNCLGFTAPGSCCPKCGGALRILYSKKQIDRALYATNISATVINLSNVLKSLERQVKIAECTLKGYLTIEMELFVSVETILNNPTYLQMQVCVLEAEKLADLINRESALITSDLGLSALSYAIAVHAYPTQGAMAVRISVSVLLISFITSYIVR